MTNNKAQQLIITSLDLAYSKHFAQNFTVAQFDVYVSNYLQDLGLEAKLEDVSSSDAIAIAFYAYVCGNLIAAAQG